jgi:hypothetical protein
VFAVAFTSSLACADEPLLRGYVEAALGASVPIADSNYRNFAQATFKPSLRGGLELRVFKRLAVAPELQLDIVPVKTNDSTYRPTHLVGISDGVYVDTSFVRYRVLGGVRFILNFGVVAAFARFLVGVDYLNGSEGEPFSVHGTGRMMYFSLPLSSTAFTVQAGIGVQFRFLKYGIAGLSIDLPTANHDFGFANGYPKRDLVNIHSLKALDVDLLTTIGFRYR